MKETTTSKKHGKVLLMIMLGMIMVLTCAKPSYAATKKAPKCATKVNIYYSTGANGSSLNNRKIFIANLKNGAKISDVKCSNSKILVFNEGTSLGLDIKGKVVQNNYKSETLTHNEKAKVTFKVRQNGKTYKLTCNVTFKRLANPLSSVTIDGKKCTFSGYSGNFSITASKPKASKVKIKITPRKGYHLTYVEAGYYKQGWAKDDTFEFKNGAYVPTTGEEGSKLYRLYIGCYANSDKQGIASSKDMKYDGIQTNYLINFK